VGIRKGRKWRRRTLRGERHSRVAYGQEFWKAQQEREIGKGRSDKPSKC